MEGRSRRLSGKENSQRETATVACTDMGLLSEPTKLFFEDLLLAEVDAEAGACLGRFALWLRCFSSFTPAASSGSGSGSSASGCSSDIDE